MSESGNVYNNFARDLHGFSVSVSRFNPKEFRPKTKNDKNRKRRKIRVKIPKALIGNLI